MALSNRDRNDPFFFLLKILLFLSYLKVEVLEWDKGYSNSRLLCRWFVRGEARFFFLIVPLLITYIYHHGSLIYLETPRYECHSSLWFHLSDTICDCIHLSTTHPALYTASLQFLSVLLNEEGRRQLQDKQSVCQDPTVSFLLDHSEECQASMTQLTELIIQVFKISFCACIIYFCFFVFCEKRVLLPKKKCF